MRSNVIGGLLTLVVLVSFISYYALLQPDQKNQTTNNTNTKPNVKLECPVCEKTECPVCETKECEDSEPYVQIPCELPEHRSEEIPNILHLVKVDGNSYPFDFFHWLIVKAATLTMKPDTIYLHGDLEPTSEWYVRAKKYITFRKVNVPTSTPKGVPITLMQHKSDFVRLEALIEFGGSYLDLDAIPLKSFDRLRKSGYEHVFGRQKYGQTGVGLMVSQKNTSLMKDFLTSAYDAFNGGWTTHSVDLLTRLMYSPKYSDSILVLDQNGFFPLSWEEPDLYMLFRTGQNAFNWQLSYALHLFRSVSHLKLHMIPEDGVKYVLTEETNLSRAVRWMVEQAIHDGDFPRPDYYTKA